MNLKFRSCHFFNSPLLQKFDQTRRRKSYLIISLNWFYSCKIVVLKLINNFCSGAFYMNSFVASVRKNIFKTEPWGVWSKLPKCCQQRLPALLLTVGIATTQMTPLYFGLIDHILMENNIAKLFQAIRWEKCYSGTGNYCLAHRWYSCVRLLKGTPVDRCQEATMSN